MVPMKNKTPIIIALLLTAHICIQAGEFKAHSGLLEMKEKIFKDAQKNIFDLDMLSAYVGNGGNLNASNRQGRLLIHFAAFNDRPDIIQFLLDNSANINAPDLIERQPIHYAARSGSVDTLQFLLQNGANLNIPTTHGRLPIDSIPNKETLVMLLGHGSAVPTELSNKLENMFERFISSTASFPMHITWQERENSISIDDLLRIAAGQNNYKLVELIITRENELTSEDYQAALLGAATAGHGNIVRLLRDHMQSDDTMKDLLPDLLSRALTNAAAQGHSNVIAALIEGAELTLNDYQTALLTAAAAGSVDVIEILQGQIIGIQQALMERDPAMEPVLPDILSRVLTRATQRGHMNVVQYFMDRELRLGSPRIDLRPTEEFLNRALSLYSPEQIAANPRLQTYQNILEALTQWQTSREVLDIHPTLDPVTSLLAHVPPELLSLILLMAAQRGLHEVST